MLCLFCVKATYRPVRSCTVSRAYALLTVQILKMLNLTKLPRMRESDIIPTRSKTVAGDQDPEAAHFWISGWVESLGMPHRWRKGEYCYALRNF